MFSSHPRAYCVGITSFFLDSISWIVSHVNFGFTKRLKFVKIATICTSYDSDPDCSKYAPSANPESLVCHVSLKPRCNLAISAYSSSSHHPYSNICPSWSHWHSRVPVTRYKSSHPTAFSANATPAGNFVHEDTD